MSDKPFGRPTDYKSEYCQMLVDHMAKGYSFESFAAVVDCGKQTLYNWKEANEDFLDAFTRGRAKHLFLMEQKGMDHLVEYHQGAKLNTALYKLFMANIHGIREAADPQEAKELTVNVILDADESKV